MIPRETIANMNLSDYHKCEDCQEVLVPQVLMSAAGYYIGTCCQCGPYSRESGYYPTREKAEIALNSGQFGRI